jgi:TetR/AcrR family transcriptional regulator, transcriptional repressor for nem operon
MTIADSPAPPPLPARSRLIGAAVRLVREQGYHATSVDQLCAAAGVSKGAFFHHFASKAALAEATAAHWSANIIEARFANAGYRQLPDPLARVLGYLDARRAWISGTPAQFSCFAGTMVQEVFQSDPVLRAAGAACITDHAATLEADFAALIAARGAGDLDARELALHVQVVVQGGFVVAKALDDPAPVLAAIEHLRRYVMLLFANRSTSDHAQETGRTEVE